MTLNQVEDLESLMIQVGIVTLNHASTHLSQIATRAMIQNLQKESTNQSLNQTTLSIKDIALKRKSAIKTNGALLKKAPIGMECLISKNKNSDVKF